MEQLYNEKALCDLLFAEAQRINNKGFIAGEVSASLHQFGRHRDFGAAGEYDFVGQPQDDNP